MKRILDRQLLYDGLESQQLYDDEIFTIHGSKFTLSKILGNNILELKTLISNHDFLQLIAESEFQTNENSEFRKAFKDLPHVFDDSEFYLSKDDGLALYYAITDNLLYLFSYGEKQPARYMLYSEGVWELADTSD
jgi:hypothetical protein